MLSRVHSSSGRIQCQTYDEVMPKLVTHVAFRALHCRPRLRIEKSCAMEIPVRRFRGLQLVWNIFSPRMT